MNAPVDGADIIIIVQAGRGNNLLPAWGRIGHDQLSGHHLFDDPFIILLDQRRLFLYLQQRCGIWLGIV
jgi:hypothetical protein